MPPSRAPGRRGAPFLVADMVPCPVATPQPPRAQTWQTCDPTLLWTVSSQLSYLHPRLTRHASGSIGRMGVQFVSSCSSQSGLEGRCAACPAGKVLLMPQSSSLPPWSWNEAGRSARAIPQAWSSPCLSHAAKGAGTRPSGIFEYQGDQAPEALMID